MFILVHEKGLKPIMLGIYGQFISTKMLEGKLNLRLIIKICLVFLCKEMNVLHK